MIYTHCHIIKGHYTIAVPGILAKARWCDIQYRVCLFFFNSELKISEVVSVMPMLSVHSLCCEVSLAC